MQILGSELCLAATDKFTSTLWAVCAFDHVDTAQLNRLLDDARICLNETGTRDDVAVWRGALLTASIILRMKHPDIARQLEEEGQTYVPGMMGN